MVCPISDLVSSILVFRGVVGQGVCPCCHEDGQHTKHPGVLSGVVHCLRLNPESKVSKVNQENYCCHFFLD